MRKTEEQAEEKVSLQVELSKPSMKQLNNLILNLEFYVTTEQHLGKYPKEAQWNSSTCLQSDYPQAVLEMVCVNTFPEQKLRGLRAFFLKFQNFIHFFL